MDAQVNFKAQEQAVEGFVSALQELKAMMKSINDLPITRLKGVDQSLVSPMQEAVKKLAESGVAMVNTMKASQAQMVKNLKATNKEMQAEVEKSASELVKAQARAMEEGAKRTEGAWRGELAMANRMYDLKSKAQAKALKELADAQAKAMSQAEAANLKAWSDDLKGFQQMLKLKVAAEAKAIADTAAFRARSASGVDARTLLGLTSESLRKSARDSAEVFKAELSADAKGQRAGVPVDVRALLGLGSNELRKSARESADVFRQAFAVEAARAKSASNIDPRTLLGLPQGTNSARASASVFAEAFKEQEQLRKATEAATKATTTYKVASRSLAEAVDDVGKRSSGAGGPLKALTNHLTDVHSAARGVASGFGLMWLTWGRLTPLLAGAALSNSLVQTAQKGKEFETVLAGIEYMGGASAAEIKQLSSAALELGATTKYGPIEVAEGLKVLSLAGLNATESLQALKPTLDFATVSELPLDKATESILGISKAFGYTAAEVSVSGDVVAKAAAVSMSAVSDMTEAFKQSSTVAQQFGVTIQDQSTMLALLAQIGIRGSAAGTAVRNMYVELMGSSKKARKVLEETLNVNIFDNATKAVKPLSTVMADLAKALSGKTFEAQTNILNALGNERGMKSISAGLSAIQAGAKAAGVSTEEFVSQFAAMQKELEDAPGFMAIAAAGMAATTENIMKSVGGSLQSSMIKAFEEMSPYLINFSIALRDVFRSPEFIQGLKDMVRFVGDSAQALATGIKFVWEFRDAVLAAGVGLVAMKSATVAAGLAALGPAVRTLTASFLIAGPAGFAAAAGTTALSGALTVLKAALGPLSIALSVAAAAYYYLSDSAEDAAKKEKDATLSANDEIKKSLEAKRDMTLEAVDKEIERLQVYIKHRGDEKKINEEMKKLADEASVSAVNSTIQKLLDMAQQEEATRKTEAATKRLLATEVERDTFLGHSYNGEYAARLRKEADALDEQGRMIRAKGEFEANVARQRQAYMAKLAKEAAGIANNNAAGRRRPTTGDGTYNPDADSGRKDRAAVLKTQLNGELQQITQRYADEVSTIKAAEQNAQNLLKASHDAKLINSGEFYARELQLASESEARQLALIEESSAAYTAQQIKDAETLQSRYASTIEKLNKNKDLTGEQREEAKVAATQALEDALIKMGDAAVTAWQKFNNDGKSIQDGAVTRMTLQAIKARGELKALDKASEAFWFAERVRQNEAASATAVEDALRYASPEQAAYIQAAANENNRLTAEMRKLQEQYEQAREALNGYTNEMLNAEIITEQMKQGEADRIRVLRELKRQMDELAGRSPGMVADAASAALSKRIKDDQAQLISSIAGAIETGLFEGGQAGKKKLRDLIVAELRKPITLFIQAAVRVGTDAIGLTSTGSGGGILGTASNAYSAYNTVTGMGGIASSAGILSGATYGTSALSSQSMMLAAQEAGFGAAGVGAAGNLGAVLTNPATLAIGALLAISAIHKATKGESRWGGQYGYNFGDGLTNNRRGTEVQGAVLGVNRLEGANTLAEAEVQAAITGTVGGINALLKSAGSSAALVGFQAGLETSGKGRGGVFAGGTLSTGAKFGEDGSGDNYAGTLFEKTSTQSPDAETALKNFALDLQQATVQALQAATDIPEALKKLVQGVDAEALTSEAATALLAGVQAQIDAVAKLGQAFEGLGWGDFEQSAYSATVALAEASGGFDALAQNLASYHENFYSETERQAYATGVLTEQLAALGQTLPGTRDAFRALVEGAEAAGNTALLAGLLSLQDEFAALVPAVEDTSQAIAQAAERIAQERSGLEREWLQVTGNTAALRALDLSALDASNRALQQQIWAYQDQQAASQAAAEAAQQAAQAYAQAQQDYMRSLEEARSFINGVAGNIRQYLDGLAAKAPGAAGYNNAAAAFSTQLTLAKGGDRDALSGITNYASTLMDAIQRESRTAEEAALRSGRVRGQLAALPGQISAEQLIVNAVNANAFSVGGSISSASAAQIEALGALGAGYATALQPVIAALGTGFSTLDTNLSNTLDFTEFSAGMQGKATDAEIQRLFNLIDVDNDQLISAAEAIRATSLTFGQQVQVSLAADFERLDTSVNSMLDFAEFSAGLVGLASDEALTSLFNLIDTDNDMLISAAEATAAATLTFGQQVQAGLAADFERLDTSVNNALSFDEFAAGFVGLATEDTLRATFAAIDTNGDGVISRLEAIAASTAAAATWAEVGVTNPYLADKPLTAVWSPDDPMRSVFTAIRESTGWLVHIHGYLGHIHNLQYQQLAAESQLHHMVNYLGGIAQGYYAVRTTSVNQSGGNYVAFAQGGAFTNGIVSRPTQFSMGLMGEAGPEAIMPLASVNGTLGVRVAGGSGERAAQAINRAMEAQQAQHRALMDLLGRLVRVHERWDRTGIPETRTTPVAVPV